VSTITGLTSPAPSRAARNSAATSVAAAADAVATPVTSKKAGSTKRGPVAVSSPGSPGVPAILHACPARSPKSAVITRFSARSTAPINVD
jgi:hypothetical protein